MNGFEKLKEQKKQNIKKAAFELFSSLGLNKVTVKDIATKANVSQVTIYNHFKNKYSLYVEIVRDHFYEGIIKMEEIINSERSTKEKMEALIIEKTKAMDQYSPLFFEEMIHDRGEVQQLIAELYEKKSLPLFLQLIEKGKQDGEINPNVSNETIIFYFGLLNQAVQEHPDFFVAKNYAHSKEFLELFFNGVMTKN